MGEPKRSTTTSAVRPPNWRMNRGGGGGGDRDSNRLLRLVLLSKREAIGRKDFEISAIPRLKDRHMCRGGANQQKHLDPIPECPGVGDDEICFSTDRTPKISSSSTCTRPKFHNLITTATRTNIRKSTQFHIHYYNELEHDIVRYGLIAMESILRASDRSSIAIKCTLGLTCGSLLASGILSIAHACTSAIPGTVAAHSLLAVFKLTVFLAVAFLFLSYSRIGGGGWRLSHGSGAFASLICVCVQFLSLVPSLYFEGRTGKCLLEDPLAKVMLIEKTSSSTPSSSSSVWTSGLELAILLAAIVCSNVYVGLLVRRLCTECHQLRSRFRTFLILSSIVVILLELSALICVATWLLHVSCSNHSPFPTYFTDLTYLKRESYYGLRETPRFLVILGCLIVGLSVPAGVASHVAVHMEYCIAACATIVIDGGTAEVADDLSAVRKRKETSTIPDHVLHASHAYSAWFFDECSDGHGAPSRYCSLWSAVRTMRRRDRVRQVVLRFVVSWSWYVCAVICPAVMASECSRTWSDWTETGGYSLSIFVAPLVSSSVLSVLANPLALIVAPLTMIVFGGWFVGLIAVQVFSFFTLVLSPNSNF